MVASSQGGPNDPASNIHALAWSPPTMNRLVWIANRMLGKWWSVTQRLHEKQLPSLFILGGKLAAVSCIPKCSKDKPMGWGTEPPATANGGGLLRSTTSSPAKQSPQRMAASAIWTATPLETPNYNHPAKLLQTSWPTQKLCEIINVTVF